jgi:predicted transcriptional regulator
LREFADADLRWMVEKYLSKHDFAASLHIAPASVSIGLVKV